MPAGANRWPSVAVAGGSIGGLTAALVLRDLGCDVHVYERSAVAPEGRGVGIVLHDATVRYLTEHDAPDLNAVSTSARYLRYLDRAGRVVYEGERNYRFTSYSALYRALLSRFEPSRYHLAHEVVAFTQEDGLVTVRLADASTRTCELLVFADGVSSTGRHLLLPAVRPQYAGYVGWRGVVEETALSAEARGALNDAITYQVVPEGHILSYPIPHPDASRDPGRRLVNVVWYRNAAPGPERDALMTDTQGRPRDSTVPPGHVRDDAVAELRAAGQDVLAPPLAEVITRASEPFIQAILDIEVPRMAIGRVCLVGDAAFAVRPHAAAATAKAAADGWALGEALEKSGGDVLTALVAWEPAQLALGSRLLDRTRRMGERSQVTGTWKPGDPSLDFGLYGPRQ
jgi:2,6-dihydroxypyridine 3-monooxygenase